MQRNWMIRLFAILLAFTLVASACGDDDDDTTAAGDDDTTTTDTGGDEEPSTDGGDGEGDVDNGLTTDDGDAEPEPTEEPEPEPTDEPEPEPTEEPAEEIPTELSGLQMVDDNTFTITLNEKDPEYFLRLGYTGFSPMPSAFYDDPVGFEEAPIGNGPMQIDGVWDHDISIATVPYEGYAGPNSPSIDSLTFNLYEDATTTGYLDLQAGNVDVVRNIPAEELPNAPGEFGDRYAESPTTVIYYYGIPSYLWDDYPLDLRRALSMAVDRELINDVILDGSNIPAASVIPPSLGGRDTVCENWTHNPDAARAAFEAYGGLDALGDQPIIVWFNTSETHAAIAEAVTNMWRNELGIDNFQFENLEFSEYLPLLDAGEMTGPFRLGWGADYLSALNFLEPLYASKSLPPVYANNTFFQNEGFDAALEAGKTALADTGDYSLAEVEYFAAEDILCEEVPSIPIYFGKNKYVWNDTVDNVYKDALSHLNYMQMVGGDIVTAAGEPEHLNPLTSNESEGIEVLTVLFEQLIEIDPRTSQPVLTVAESITTEDGGLTWTVVVADGWTFHDGEAVTAASFVDAWNYAALGANGMQNNGFFSSIEGYDAMNPPAEEE